MTKPKAKGGPKTKTKTVLKCSVYGCQNNMFRKGLCQKHYNMQRQGQDLDQIAPPPDIQNKPIKMPQMDSKSADFDADLESMDYAELTEVALVWQIRQRQESTKKVEMENQVREGNLVEIEHATSVSFEIISRLVSRLRQVQYTLTPQLVGQKNPKKIQDIIEGEMNKAFLECEGYLNANQ